MMKRYAGRALESITPEEAQLIIHVSSMYDMPMLDYVSTTSALCEFDNECCTKQYADSLALFQTYAIVRILAPASVRAHNY